MVINPLMLRFVVSLLLILASLAPFRALYACELVENERPSRVCCCDAADNMGVVGCEGGACQDQFGMVGECCEISYEPSQIKQLSVTSTQFQQVLLLDAAQPPPLPVLFYFPDLIPVNRLVHFEPDPFSALPDKPVYLLTSRFRI